MKIVVALGGNALSKRGKPMTAENQRANARIAALSMARLIEAGHQLVITHGNGPQVGMLGLQAAAGPKDGNYSLDLLGAESEGFIGYIIEQELRNVQMNNALIATVLTQTLVDPEDPALQRPTKPVGPVYDEATARGLEKERGWQVAPDGPHWRRVVASPDPVEILQMEVIRMLVEGRVTVICAGGGGIPVTRNASGELVGIEAVIDKDLASTVVARLVSADMLLLLTDVDAVYSEFGKPNARRIARMAAGAIVMDQYAAGSMRPKLEAAKRFVIATGKAAAVGRLEDALEIVGDTSGTMIVTREAASKLRVEPLSTDQARQ